MFEWDENKNQINIEKHGISLPAAAPILLGPRWETRSDQHGEMRWKATGKLHGKLWTVVYTFIVRNGSYRLISARRASNEESRKYRELHP